MRYFTKEWYALCQMRNPTPDDVAKMKKAGENYRAAIQGQDIPLSLQTQFVNFHDHSVIGYEISENAFVLRIENYERNKPEIKISFHDARVKKQDASFEGCDWLYAELYRHYIGYEAHILFQRRKGLDLAELIIQCRDISVMD